LERGRGFRIFVGNRNTMNEKENSFELVEADHEPIENHFRRVYEAYADKAKYDGFYKIHGMGDTIPFGTYGEITVKTELKMLGHEFLTWCIREVDWFLLEPEILDRLEAPTYSFAKEFDIGISEEDNERENAEFRAEIKQFHSEKVAKLKASGAREWPGENSK